ncbi:biopolymer transporter ExbD, partial [Paracoccaceae bacterium]|nr:biopolymer transporter ExbD [Paracoccaceae bacterium]
VEKEKPLTISIDKDKKIFINEFEIDRDGLRSKLLAIKKERGSNRVFLRASGKIGYENVASILALLSNSGFSQISLVTDIKID